MRRISETRSFAAAAFAVGAALLMFTASATGDSAPASKASELMFDAASNARVRNRLVGAGMHEYTFEAKKGQRVALVVSSDWAELIGIYLLPPGVDTPIYTNFIDGSTNWRGVVPGNGTYTVRLAFLRSESRRTGLADYELKVKLSDVKRVAARR